MIQQQAIIPTQFLDFSADYISSLARERGAEYLELALCGKAGSSIYDNPATNTRKLHILNMIVDGLPCEYYTAEYTPIILSNNSIMRAASSTASDNATGARYQIQVFSVTLPYSVEDLYVESKTNFTLNNILGLSSVVFKSSKRVSLEGDFNYFFNVYVPNNEELNAFTILAPNIMVRMLETASNYDFEFSGDKIYFYQTFKYFNPSKIILKKAAYESLLAFGVESAKAMARAARPAKLADIEQNTPMWQLYGLNNTKLILQIVLLMGPLLFILACLSTILLWPIAFLASIALISGIAIKYRRFKFKHKRLLDFRRQKP